MQASTEFGSNSNTMLNEEQEFAQHSTDDDNDDHNFDANELLNTFRLSFSTVNSILGNNLNHHLGLSAASCESWSKTFCCVMM
jgi:hypothetical protein